MSDKNASKKIIRTSLLLGLIVFAFIITPGPSYFSVINDAMAAGTLTNVKIVPMTSTPRTYTTYDFLFRTGTTGTIKTIEIIFPVTMGLMDVRNATILIERSGIGPGTISVSLGGTSQKLTYTVTNATSVPAKTNIRLEVASLFAAPFDYVATITTKGGAGNIIDGPTQSPTFRIQ